MTTKIEDLTDEQLDVLVAETVMEWTRCPDCEAPHWRNTGIAGASWNWSPSTNIVHVFQVDKPEWRWGLHEFDGVGPPRLSVDVWPKIGYGPRLANVEVPMDPDNKTAAYCRGRCIAVLKACGVEEV